MTSWVACSACAKRTSAVADVVADDLVVRAAELLEQLAVLLEHARRRCREAVARPDVDADQLAAGALRHARRRAG